MFQTTAPNGTTVLAPTSDPIDFDSAIQGQDYYERILDVILHIQTRSTPAAATAADQYRRAVSKAESFAPDDFTDPSTRRKRAKRNARMIDESWKHAGRRRFPKKRTAIGEEVCVISVVQ